MADLLRVLNSICKKIYLCKPIRQKCQADGTFQMNTFQSFTHLSRQFHIYYHTKKSHNALMNKAREAWFVPFCRSKLHLYDDGNFIWDK